MNLREAKLKAIKLVDEYSNNGVLIPEQKNADYTLRMNELANDAQIDIATTARKIHATFKADVNNADSYVEIELPKDIFQIIKIEAKENNIYRRILDYRFNGKENIVVKSFNGQFVLHYYKYPTIITNETEDTYEFELDLEAQQLIPYYIASHVKLDEEPTVSVQLANEYQLKLSRLKSQYLYGYGIETIQNVTGW